MREAWHRGRTGGLVALAVVASSAAAARFVVRKNAAAARRVCPARPPPKKGLCNAKRDAHWIGQPRVQLPLAPKAGRANALAAGGGGARKTRQKKNEGEATASMLLLLHLLLPITSLSASFHCGRPHTEKPIFLTHQRQFSPSSLHSFGPRVSLHLSHPLSPPPAPTFWSIFLNNDPLPPPSLSFSPRRRPSPQGRAHPRVRSSASPLRGPPGTGSAGAPRVEREERERGERAKPPPPSSALSRCLSLPASTSSLSPPSSSSADQLLALSLTDASPRRRARRFIRRPVPRRALRSQKATRAAD